MKNPLFTSDESSNTVVAAGCELEGKLTCKGPSRISGLVKGDLNSDDHLTLGPEAKVEGNVFGQSVEVCGTVNGAVRAVTKVILRSGSFVDGEIECPSIVIDEGAKFNGMTKMSSPEPAAQPLSVVATGTVAE